MLTLDAAVAAGEGAASRKIPQQGQGRCARIVVVGIFVDDENLPSQR